VETFGQPENVVAIVAGGTSGIGLAAAAIFAREGVTKLLLVGRDESRGARAVKQLLEETGVEAHFVSCDLSVADDARRMAAEAVERWGRVDVLVNSLNSGSIPTLVHRYAMDDLTVVLAQRANYVLNSCGAVLPIMRKQGSGSIVNVASDAAKVPTPGEAVIGAAMAAIVVFSKTLAIEAKRDGVRVNIVTPSLVTDSGGYDQAMSDAFSAKVFTKAVERANLGVPGPDDVAAAIVFLAGDQASKITGQALSVNGGISTV
jgi:2-hydroxycyclohexanecarboxyl-CoA dehydrogenase